MDLMLGLDSKITTIQTTKIKPLIKYKVLHFKKNVLFSEMNLMFDVHIEYLVVFKRSFL